MRRLLQVTPALLSFGLVLAMPFAHCVAATVTHFVSAEVIERLVSTFGMRTGIAMVRIEAVINMAVKFAWTVEPWAGSDENAAVEPLRSVVSVWRAVVRCDVIVTVRARRLWSDIDGDLSACRARNAQRSGNQGRDGKKFPIAHEFLLAQSKATQMPTGAKHEERNIYSKERANAEHLREIGPIQE